MPPPIGNARSSPTGSLEELTDERMARFGKDADMKRPAQPEELSPAYVFLAAPACSGYITGIVLPVTGSVGDQSTPEVVLEDLRLGHLACGHPPHAFLERLRRPGRVEAGGHGDVPRLAAAGLRIAGGEQAGQGFGEDAALQLAVECRFRHGVLPTTMTRA